MTQLPRPPRAILLDVGGVLLLPRPDVVRRAFARAGAVVDPAPPEDAHYRAIAATESGGAAWSGFAGSRYWIEYARAAGVPEALVEPAGREMHRVQSLGESVWTHPVRGGREGLMELSRTGAEIVLVTNTERGHAGPTLRRHGICQVGAGPGVAIRAIVDSARVGVAKPDPRIFRIALDRAAASPAEAVHAGDSLRSDVDGARGAGIAAVHLDPLSLCPGRDHPHVVSLTGLAELIRRQPDERRPGPRAR